MIKRTIKKQFWFDRTEIEMLKEKCKKAGIKEAPLIRNLVMGYEPREKPDDRFYEVMKDMRLIANTLNKIAKDFNVQEYKEEAEKWNKFMLDIKSEFLIAKKDN